MILPENLRSKEVLFSYNLIDENEFHSMNILQLTTFYDKMIIDHNGYFAKFHWVVYVIACLTSSYVYAYMSIFDDEHEVSPIFYSLLLFYECFFIMSFAMNFIISYQDTLDKTKSVRSFTMIAKRYFKT